MSPPPFVAERAARTGLRGRTLRLTLAVLVPWLAATGCASLAGLSGGREDAGGESGIDSARPDVVDATKSVDAGPPDADTGAATSDASRSDVNDASHESDVSDAVCTPFLPDAGPPGKACSPAPDGSVCAPRPVTDAAIAWRPPEHATGACTPDQAKAFLDACIGPSSNGSACSAFLSANSSNVACSRCLDTDQSSSTYGPLIVVGSAAVVLNIGGCIALADPCNLPCAEAVQAHSVCQIAACPVSCAPDASFTATTLATCGNAADTCVCEQEQTASGACFGALSTAASTANCFPSSGTFVDVVYRMAGLFCGDGTWNILDAGTSG